MYRCAIIGCGNIASYFNPKDLKSWTFSHAGAYALHPETELIAAADPSETALRDFGEKWGVQKLYPDFREMLEKEAIDIVSLALPTENHFEAFQAVSEKNIPAIFCEKPLAYDLEEARKMVQMASDRIVSVNYFRRWNPSFQKLRDELESNAFGSVKNITVRYTKGLFGNASHLVDLLRFFFGEPNATQLIKIYDSKNQDFGADFSLEFDQNLTAYFLHVPEVDYVFIDIEILTEKGRITISQRGQTIKKDVVVQEPHFEKFNILKSIEEKETNWRECFPNAISEMIHCLKNGGTTTCTPEDAFKTLEICHEIAASKEPLSFHP